MISKVIKKLFGGIELTWPRLILCAVVAGIYTAVVAIIPGLKDTSFHTIAVTFEVWILFGILIIMNSKSNLDSALKCFVFFLISQPLVYLIQVPFSWQGWNLFGYYKYWFIWTILCVPMGFIGYWMKKGKWWGYLILFPMILLTIYSYLSYFSDFLFYRTRYVLISLFCVTAVILYPLAIFENKRMKLVGTAISGALIIAATTLCLLHPPVYNTVLMLNNEEHPFDDSYSVYFESDKYGEVQITYHESLEDYAIEVGLKRAGEVTMVLESPKGEKKEYDLWIYRDHYDLKQK